MPTQAFETLKEAIETDTVSKINYENLIKENPGIASENNSGYSLFNYACLRLYKLLPLDGLCKSEKYGRFQSSNLKDTLTKLSEIRDVATQLLRAGAIPTETDKTFFMSVLRRFTDQTASSGSASFTEILKEYRELTNEFLKRGFNFTLQNESQGRPVTGRMQADEFNGYIQWVREESANAIPRFTN